MKEICLFLIIGLVSGAISGMGLGGGAVLIPSLTIITGMEQHMAQSLNLLVFVPTAAIALFVHARNRYIERGLLLKMILAGLLFAALGSFVALRLEPGLLRKIFGGFLLLIGLSELFKKQDKDDQEPEN